MTNTKKAEINEAKRLIKESPEHTVGALIQLFNSQEADEVANAATIHQNSIGFNGLDASFLTDLANFYQERGFLTPGQMKHATKLLPKYARQLIGNGGLKPLTFATEKPETETDGGNGAAKPEVKNFDPKEKICGITKDGTSIGIAFPFEWAVKDQVKSLSGARFHKDKKTSACWWSIPMGLTSIDSIQKLTEWGFRMKPRLADWYRRMTEESKPITDIEGLQGDLFDFQAEGLGFIEKLNGRALIGDEMGLGKTISALAYLQNHPEKRPALVVCPAGLKLNWKKEAEKWMSEVDVQILTGRTPSAITGDLVIINYDILGKQKTIEVTDEEGKTHKVQTFVGTGTWAEALMNHCFEVMIMDECHYIKNEAANRTKALMELGAVVPSVLGLSGTPIVNRPMELFNAISLIDPSIFPSRWKYKMKYCGAAHNGHGWDFKGATNTKELNEILTKTIMLRRLKKDVLKDLPAKIRHAIPMELDNRAEYNRAEQSFIRWLREQEGDVAADNAMRAEALVRISKLRKLTIKGKLKESIEWIENFLEQEDKLVVFAIHKDTITALVKHFTAAGMNPVVVDGSVSQKDRDAHVLAFQNDPTCRLFIGNVKAAGVGITLHAASNTCFVEIGWTPGEMDQAEDRVHRIGQEADSVGAHYLIAQDSIEDWLSELIDEKRKVLDAVLDGKDVEETSMLRNLLAKASEERS